MNVVQRTMLVAVIGVSVALCACSNDSGMSSPGGITPPVQQGVQPGAVSPGAHALPGQPSATPSAPPGDSVTYAFADASDGLRCPEVDGYSCIIHLNVLPPATSPKPTPTATSSPSLAPSASASPSPSPAPSSTPAITMALEAEPRDVPSMVNADSKSVSTTALVALRLSTSQNVLLKGTASADFILPQGQIGGREFAVQLFRETSAHRNRHVDRYVGSYAESTVDGDTLHFAISPPHVTVQPGETWLLVLYANEKPLATQSPSPKSSPNASPGASPAPSPNPSSPTP